MPNRCAWTNEESDRVKEIVVDMPDRLAMHPKPTTFYVLPEYEQRLRRFIRHLERFGLKFLLSILILVMALPIAAVMRRYPLLGVVVVLMGIDLVVFPFATPETVKLLGFGSSIVLVRAIGFVAIVIGLSVAATAWVAAN